MMPGVDMDMSLTLAISSTDQDPAKPKELPAEQ